MLEANPWVVAGVSGMVSAVMFYIYRSFAGKGMLQNRREDGPRHHLAKGDVPTGTGIIIVILLMLAGILVWTSTDYGLNSTRIGIYVCWAAATVGMLGFVDDRRKVTVGSVGLKARYKLAVMVVVGLFLLYLLSTYFAEVRIVVGLSGDAMPWPIFAPWWLYYPVGLFIWLGALNGANFTDGLDGLLSCTTLVVLAGVFYALLDGNEPLALPAAVGFGFLVAYLMFNWKPALIYMGDSGALAIGALVAGLFLAKGWWLFLGLCAFVWVVEVASVMIQVSLYKTTGKRLFLMTPIHHHFELAGWGERTTVVIFTVLQALGCAAAFLWLREGVAWGLGATIILVTLMVALIVIFRKRVR